MHLMSIFSGFEIIIVGQRSHAVSFGCLVVTLVPYLDGAGALVSLLCLLYPLCGLRPWQSSLPFGSYLLNKKSI